MKIDESGNKLDVDKLLQVRYDGSVKTPLHVGIRKANQDPFNTIRLMADLMPAFCRRKK